jgi:hypothetical protein
MDPGTFIAVAVVLAAAVGWILTGRLKTYEAQLREVSSGGDGADRLIEQEQRRSPGVSREAAAKRVLDQLRRDSQ